MLPPEEAFRRGIPLKKTQHSMQRRARWWRYDLPGIYHLTLVARYRQPVFGELAATPLPHIVHSALGEAILNDEIPKIHAVYPNVSVEGLCLMPDHLHMIVDVSEAFKQNGGKRKKDLGSVITGFKTGCNRLWWQVSGHKGEGLFVEGYNDGINISAGQIDAWSKYIADNPRRLAEKKANPDLFVVLRDQLICGIKCMTCGNHFLLDYPDKAAVVVHKRYTDSDFASLREQWLACGARGGVLIGTSIAPREKEVFHEAMERGYRLIWLRDKGFGPYYKPAGRAFDACAEGRLLQISPWEYTTRSFKIDRNQCMKLNTLAINLAGGELVP